MVEEVSCELTRANFSCRLIESKLVLKGCTSLTKNNETGNFIRPLKDVIELKILVCFLFYTGPHTLCIGHDFNFSVFVEYSREIKSFSALLRQFYALTVFCLRMNAGIVRR
jgi:hypothetical protein